MSNWGPAGWKFLHAITRAYPDKPSEMTKKRYLTFFKSIQYVLPCPVCQIGFASESKDLKMSTLKNRQTLVKWLITVHNRINKKLGKKIFIPSPSPNYV
jgi:hypothetical protein